MRKIRVSAQISLQYLHEDKAVQERQKPKNQYIMEDFTMTIKTKYSYLRPYYITVNGR